MPQNLKMFLKCYKLTRTQLAMHLNVNRRSVFNWERGRTGISLKTARRWRDLFGELPPFLEIKTPHSHTLAHRHRKNQEKRLEKLGLRLPELAARVEEIAVKCRHV